MKAIVAAVALAGLSVAGCSGSSPPPDTARQAGEPTTASTEPHAPALSGDPAVMARAGASVTPASIPAVAHRGETVTAAFNARPGAACQLQLQGGGADAPLPPAVADPSGRVTWTWKLSPQADVGTLTAWVSCSGGALAQAQLTVA
jgi:hypothetical protein